MRKKELERENKILKGYLELISELAYDYDGCNTTEGLKELIDELRHFADLALELDTDFEVYMDDNKHFNILGEKLK